jgi:hypothetical protein
MRKSLLREKKGQAAMEFLMTYGWAILVVLVVIGALAYFGVLNPGRFLPEKCQLPVGLSCTGHVFTVADGGDNMVINNGLGTDITITEIRVETDTDLFGCANALGVGDGMAGDLTMIAGATTNIPLTCTAAVGSVAGQRVRGTIFFQYTNLQTGLINNIRGDLVTDLQ